MLQEVLSSTEQEERVEPREESRRPLEQMLLLGFPAPMGTTNRSSKDSLELWLLMSKAPVLGDSFA